MNDGPKRKKIQPIITNASNHKAYASSPHNLYLIK